MKYLVLLSLAAIASVANADLLYDNGSFTTSPGLSAIKSGGSTFGYGASTSVPVYVADNFTLAADSTLTSLTVYGYQTNATTPTITGGSWAIYASAPIAQNTPALVGSLATTVAANSVFTDIYRVDPVDPTSTARRISAVTFNLNSLNLAAGNYFVAWAMTGSANLNGPWAIPVNYNAASANSLQSVGTSDFTPITDSRNFEPDDLAFQIQGTRAVPEPASMAVLGFGALALLRRLKAAK